MDKRKPSDNTADVTRKTKHCIDRSVVGGPYVGRGGNNGFVLSREKTMLVYMSESQRPSFLCCDFGTYLDGAAASNRGASAS